MRYGVIAETLLERAFPRVRPGADGDDRRVRARIRSGHHACHRTGDVRCPRPGALSTEAIASACKTDVRATEKLLNLLVTMRYLKWRDGMYRLNRHVRRWLLAHTPGSVRDAVLMKRLEWRWIEKLDSFLQNGQPLDVHGNMTHEDWGAYQRGMRAQANLIAPLLARQIPVPAGASEMLDIGGSHGYFSVVLCRRHPGLRATVSTSRPRSSMPPRSWRERRWGTESPYRRATH